MDSRYAVLMETSGREYESWLTFIKVEGNETNLKHLNDQLAKVEWYILDEYSTFDLELERTVSEHTAKEMTKLDLNPTMFHIKFDGVLQRIDLDLDTRPKNKKKIKHVNSILGFGGICEFIDNEDVDEEDLDDGSSSSSDSDASGKGESSDSEDDNEKCKKLPPSLRLKDALAKRKAERQPKARK